MAKHNGTQPPGQAHIYTGEQVVTSYLRQTDRMAEGQKDMAFRIFFHFLKLIYNDNSSQLFQPGFTFKSNYSLIMRTVGKFKYFKWNFFLN